MQTENYQAAANLLLQARATGTRIDSLPPHLLPADVGAAYAIQDLITASLGPIGGWKTAAPRNGVKFNWAPIPASGIYRNGAKVSLSQLVHCELELEIGFVVKTDLPPRATAYSGLEVAAALGELCVCLELFASRYIDRLARTAVEITADAQSALGVVIGSGRSDWSAVDLGLSELQLNYAGQAHKSTGGRELNDVLEACTDLANGTFRLGGLRAGQVIITGARIGPIPLDQAGAIAGTITSVGAAGIEVSQ